MQSKAPYKAAGFPPLAKGQPNQHIGLALRIESLVTHRPTNIVDVQEGISEGGFTQLGLPGWTEQVVGIVPLLLSDMVEIAEESAPSSESPIIKPKVFRSVGVIAWLGIVRFPPKKDDRGYEQKANQGNRQFERFGEDVRTGAG